jgi:predicted phage tail protein
MLLREYAAPGVIKHPLRPIVRGADTSSGGGGASGGDPNTLQTDTVGRFLYLCGEGPFDAVLANGFQSLFFNGVPVQNPDGTFNFNGLWIDTREGDPSQTPMAGFSDVETEFPVGTEMLYQVPLTQAVTNLNADRVRVTIELPSLYFVDQSSGAAHIVSVWFQVAISSNGGPFQVVLTQGIADKCISPASLSYDIPLPGDGPWVIQVQRLSINSGVQPGVNNQTFWQSFTVIQDFALQYPNSGLIGIMADAAQYGTTIPLVECESRGIRSEVPSNWNPVTRAYTGIWDGTFKVAYHDSPAWFVWGCASNPRWGAGEFVPKALTDKWKLYQIAQFCDQLVPDGAGGLEPRYRLCAYIDRADDAIRVLAQVCSVFRGMPFWGPMLAGGCGVSFFADMPADPVRIITPQNVIDGRITYQGAGLTALTTVFLTTWYDPQNSFKKEVLPVEAPPEIIARYGWRAKPVIAWGAPSRGQAWRTAQWLLEESFNGEVASWVSSWDQADLVPGEMTAVMDRSYNGLELSGRVTAISFAGAQPSGIVLDRQVTLKANLVYGVMVTLPDGTVAQANVTNGAGPTQTIAFDNPLTQTPVLGAIWALTSASVKPRPFRIINRKEQDKHLFSYSAKFFDVTAQARIEENRIIEAPKYTALPTGPLAVPGRINVHEGIVLTGGGVARADATVSWSAADDPRAVQYQLQVLAPGALNFTDVPSAFTAALSLDVYDLQPGQYFFRVRALDGLGAMSLWSTSQAVNLLGLKAPLAALPSPGLSASYVDGVYNFRWPELTGDPRPIRYEIRRGAAGSTANDAQTITTVLHPPFESYGDGTYFLAPKTGPDTDPVYGPWSSATISGATLISATSIVAKIDFKARGWPGAFTGGAGIDTTLNAVRSGGANNILADINVLTDADVLTGGVANGGYDPQIVVSIGRVASCPMDVTWTAVGIPVGQNVLADANVLTEIDVLGAAGTRLVNIYPEIGLAQTGPGDVFSDSATALWSEIDIFDSGVTWTFQQWVPGAQLGYQFWLRWQLQTSDPGPPGTTAYLLAAVWTVSLPVRTDHLNGVTIPAGGLAVVFKPDDSGTAASFNFGPGGVGTLPNIQATIHSTNGAVKVSGVGTTLSGTTLFAYNTAGVAVTETKVDVAIQGA